MPMFVGQIITPRGVLLNVHYTDQFQSSSVIYLRNVSLLMTFIKFYPSEILHNLLLRVRLRTRVVSSRMFYVYVDRYYFLSTWPIKSDMTFVM